MNNNLWKIALPVLATVTAAALGLWMQPRSQPATLDDALVRFALPEGSFDPASDCPSDVGMSKTNRSRWHDCRETRR